MTRDEAIKCLQNLEKSLDGYYGLNEKGKTTFNMAIKALKQPERNTGKWIPCSERLPKTHETGNSFSGIYMQSSPVLVYGVPEYEEEYGFHVVTYCDDKNGCTYWSTELDAVTINEVYAWMPLPEPWKGEQK